MPSWEKIKNFFSSSSIITLNEDWNILTRESQLDLMLQKSKHRPQLIYKHGPKCPVCIMAKRNIESHFSLIQEKAAMHFVHVLKARSVSNALAERVEVVHESPQVLIIHHGQSVWDASHSAIKADTILKVLEESYNVAT